MRPGSVLCLAAALTSPACDDVLEPVPLGWREPRVFPTRVEIDLGFQGDDGAILAGTLMLPVQPGPHPAVVFHFGSNRWTRMRWEDGGPVWWIQNGIAVFTYDKRGVGLSQGECCPWRDPDYFPLLGTDVAAAGREVAAHGEIRGDLVGAWGFSQGGWVVPVAAVESGGDLAFTIIGSGPAVTLEEELLYSALTGENDCEASGLSSEEIERQLDEAGPGGFDPGPWLEAMTAPGLWIYGGLDLSVPVDRSVGNLHEIRDRLGKDFVTVVFPDLNHSWVIDGGICQQDGPGGIDGAIVLDWLTARFDL
jgi:pimeloyl-ACP methyl ester carboxylesterase